MRVVVALSLAMASCAVAPPPEKRINIVLRNSTDQRLEFQTQVGFLGKQLQIPAGYTWRGWVPRDFVAREIFIEVVPAPSPDPEPEKDEPSQDRD